MNSCGFFGWTSLWGTIYVLKGQEENTRLIKHEQTHLIQMERDGKIPFLFKYAYWHLRYGYKNNPYEVEAREAERM